jgi:hypothetical protein
VPERDDPGPRRQPYGPLYQPHPQQYPPSGQSGFSPRQPYPQQREPYSPPRQPWAPQGYEQPPQPQFTRQTQFASQPQYVPRPQYPPQPPYAPVPPPGRYGPRPPQRSRHTARNVIAGIGGLTVLIIGIAVAANSGHSVKTAGSAAAVSNNGGGGGGSKTAGIGSAITLSGNGSGEQMSVTVTKVISDASASDSFDELPAGDRLYAVQFRLSDTGAAAYSDSPSNGAAVVDSAGQSYQSGLENVAACQSFGGTENIAAGNSGLGCIVFEVPTKAKITQVQFTLDSGMGPDTGQWDVG